MIQCQECELAEKLPGGRIAMRCNPLTNIKEEACLLKWQLFKIDTMVQAYQATVQAYQRLAPLQEKMFRQIEKEVDDIEEGDAWKRGADENDPEDQA